MTHCRRFDDLEGSGPRGNKEVIEMQSIMATIKQGIQELFPAAMDLEIVPDTALDDIPDWDSMSSVNFKVFLEETFKVPIPEDLLNGGSTIGDIVAYVGNGHVVAH
jgi:acyl carrier protein